MNCDCVTTKTYREPFQLTQRCFFLFVYIHCSILSTMKMKIWGKCWTREWKIFRESKKWERKIFLIECWKEMRNFPVIDVMTSSSYIIIFISHPWKCLHFHSLTFFTSPTVSTRNERERGEMRERKSNGSRIFHFPKSFSHFSIYKKHKILTVHGTRLQLLIVDRTVRIVFALMVENLLLNIKTVEKN